MEFLRGSPMSVNTSILSGKYLPSFCTNKIAMWVHQSQNAIGLFKADEDIMNALVHMMRKKNGVGVGGGKSSLES